MVKLTGPSDSQSEATSAPREPDDRSDNAHRQLIGYIGLALPLILWLIAGWRPTDRLRVVVGRNRYGAVHPVAAQGRRLTVRLVADTVVIDSQ